MNAEILADDLVDEWHTSSTESPLHEYMLLTHNEYKRYVEEAELPVDFLERHGRD